MDLRIKYSEAEYDWTSSTGIGHEIEEKPKKKRKDESRRNMKAQIPTCRDENRATGLARSWE